MEENKLLILLEKKNEIFSHFNVRYSKKSNDRFTNIIESGDFAICVRWGRHVTNNKLTLKYLKDYFESMLSNNPSTL